MGPKRALDRFARPWSSGTIKGTMIGMTSAAPKLKVSVTLPADLVAAVDDEARREGHGNRSDVMARWLRRASRSSAQGRLEQATVDYYESLTAEQRAEDDALARALSKKARRLVIDDSPRKRR